MIVDKKGNLFEDRRNGTEDRRKANMGRKNGKKDRRKDARRKENNKIIKWTKGTDVNVSKMIQNHLSLLWLFILNYGLATSTSVTTAAAT